MGMYGRIVMTFIVLSSLLLFSSIVVCAQPLGIMSPQAQQNVLSSSNGRFVFGQISDSGKDRFMLDTFSGRLWQIAESGEIGIFLRTVPYRTANGECSPLPENISESESKNELNR
ncbi:MAG: hypothetical protein JRJ02_12170 [Deltaproteobacteria bacterium]|nr:hypothetical protein [Deltaproteobacteria bacterium]